MNWVDWLLIAILLQSMVTGFVAGFARVGVGFVAAVLGMIFGFWSYGMAASHLSDYITSPALANLAGFLLIFGFFVLVGAIVGRILSYFFKWTGLSMVDRLLGLGFGFVRGVLVVTVLVTVLLAFAPTPAPRSVVQSRMLPYITSPALANLAGFLLIFGFFVLVGAIVGRILSYFFKWTGLSIVDRLLGLGFGFVRGVLVVTVLVTVLLAFAPTPAPRSVVQSRMLPYIIDTSGVLAAITPHEIKDAFYGTRDSVKKLWSDHVRGSKLAQQEL